MFYQTDTKLQFEANSDCYLFDILRIIEKTGKFEYTRDQVKKIREISVRADFMGKDGYLNAKGISGIGTVSSGLIKKHVYIKRVGNNDNYNNIIGKFMRPISNSDPYYHFNLMDFLNPKLVEWDSWSRIGARTTREGSVVEFRYIFAEAI